MASLAARPRFLVSWLAVRGYPSNVSRYTFVARATLEAEVDVDGRQVHGVGRSRQRSGRGALVRMP